MENMFKRGKIHPFLFSHAVRDHKPVCVLEDMRKMERYCWEGGDGNQTFTLSEVLRYAIVHDHRDYAQYLLNRFSGCAFAMPGENSGQLFVPHLIIAVRYDRKDILALMLQAAHKMSLLHSCINQRSQKRTDNGMTALHLACMLSRPELVTLLLGSGASPQAEENSGMKPLDLILKRLKICNENTRATKLCLEKLLLFMPELRFKMTSCLKDDPQCWSQVLGEETYNYLVGRTPGTLFLISMQKILSKLPVHDFSKSLDQLPMPTFLNPLTLPTQT